jgi:hypothetical protein
MTETVAKEFLAATAPRAQRFSADTARAVAEIFSATTGGFRRRIAVAARAFAAKSPCN